MRLTSRIHKEVPQFNSNKIIQLKKRAKDLNRHFFKEDIQMANKHIKRCSTSLIIKETQIKATVRHRFTPIRVARKENTESRCWRGCGEMQLLCMVGGNVKWCSYSGKHCGSS